MKSALLLLFFSHRPCRVNLDAVRERLLDSKLLSTSETRRISVERRVSPRPACAAQSDS